MEEWKEYKFGKVAVFSQGIQVGIEKQIETCKEGYVRFIRIVDYTKGTDAPRYILYPGARYMVDETDIVMMRYGTPGKVARGYSGAIANNMFKITVNEDFLNKDYTFYYLSQDSVYRTLVASNSSSTMPAINFKIIEGLDISAPSISEQMRIVKVLKSLDDKIEVNKRINENLEQQARALFKSWFVDFEPFKDGEFVESELGMIPKGWRVGKYDDIIESTISGDWGKENPEGNYTHKVACIRGCDFQDIKNGLRGKTPERYILEKNFQTKHFKDKDVLVEISGGTATVSTGRVCPVSQLLIDKFNADIVCTNFCRLVRPKNKYGAYLYYSWLYKYNNKVMFGYENGTSGIKNFRIKDFTALEPVVIPSEEALLSFQSMIDKLQMKLQMNGSESQKLATLRDTLLPKLMSGELKVNEVEI